jgi:quercetin dioxygenase-like cupin family protein
LDVYDDMKLQLLAPTMGLGLGLTALWTLATQTGRQWLHKVAIRLGLQRKRPGFTAVNAFALDWRRNAQHQDLVTFFMKPLFQDPRTGEVTQLVRYPAGQMNPAHTHPFGHGMYVLQGTLVTHRGSFGRDTFVWFPPNELMRHGAGPDEDLVVLFTTTENQRIDYAPHAR